MRSRRAALTAVLALAVVPVAGCGSSGNDAAADAQAAYAPVKAQLLALGPAVVAAVTKAPKQTDVSLGQQFDALAARVNTQETKLDGLALPSSAKVAGAALRDALAKVTADLSDIATAAKAHDAAAARIAAEKLVSDAAKVKPARTAFEQSLNAAK